MLFNRSITTQFTIAFVVALLMVVGSFYLVLDSVYRNELKSQAETVATARYPAPIRIPTGPFL